MSLAHAQEVLEFWFGPPPRDAVRAEWFKKDAAFDEQIRTRFSKLMQQALDGGLREWAALPSTAAARIVLLDQFTRNLNRGSAAAFSGDALALAAARAMVAHGDDLRLTGAMRSFVYLPFEHSESAEAQAESLRLFSALARQHPAQADAELWAKKHAEIIARFGRYPHRNAALGRESTPEEVAFLREPGSSF